MIEALSDFRVYSCCILNNLSMKAENGNVQYFGHESEYLVLLVITLVVFTILDLPLFMAFFPVTFLYGCLEIRHLVHIKKHKHLATH
jgi:hypothetical protein